MKMKPFFRKKEDYYECKGCVHNCATWNKGKTFAVGSVNDNKFAWLKQGEYAPCGEKLTLHSMIIMKKEA